MSDFTNLAQISFTLNDSGTILTVEERAKPMFYELLISKIENLGLNSVISEFDLPKVMEAREEAARKGGEYTVTYNLEGLQYVNMHVKETGTCLNESKAGGATFQAQLLIESRSGSALMFSGIYAMIDAVNQASIVTLTTRSGKIIFANDLFVKYSKYSKSELLGQDHRIVNSGYHPKSFFIDLWKTISSGKVWKGEIKNKAKDGSFYWVDTVISPVFNDQNEIIQYVSIRTVITERKKVEENLIKREDMLNTAQQIARIGSWEFDVSEGELIWTDEVYNIFERDKKTFKPSYEAFIELVHPDDREKVDKAYQESLESRTRYKVEHRYIALDGSIKHVLEQSEHTFNDKGDQIRSYGTVQDITELKQVNLELESQRNRIESILTATELGAWELDVATGNLTINTGWAESIGYKPEELEPVNVKSWVTMVHPDDVSKFFQSFKRLSNGQVINCHCEIRMKHKNGRWLYMLEKGKVIETDSEGRPKLIYGVQQDITEVKQKEIEIEKSNRRFKNLLENISDGFMVDDKDGNVVFANKRFYEIFKIDPEDINIHMSDYVHEDFAKALLNRHNRRMRGEEVEDSFEYRGKTQNGEAIWVKVRVAAVMEDGQMVGTQSILSDITEQKEREAQLLELAEFNRMIIDSTDEVFYIKEADEDDPMKQAFAYVSEKISDIIGEPRTKLMNRSSSWFEFIHPDDRKQYTEHLLSVRSTGEAASIIYRCTPSAEKLRWVLEYTKPHYDERSRQLELYGSLKDVTDLKEKEAHLKNLLEEVNKKNNELQQFNYIVSHNLRSPIVNALGLLGLLQDSRYGEDDHDKFMEMLAISIKKMDVMVKDLNEILETKSLIGTRHEEVRLEDILMSIRGTLRTQIEESGTKFTIQIAPEIGPVYSVKSYLESILYNLVSNALKYRASDRTPEVEVSVAPKNGEIHIQVRDNGIGMDLKKHQGDLFGLYKRFNTNTSGKGLGLHMTKAQVEALDGRIEVQSEMGKGSVFTLILPHKQEHLQVKKKGTL